MRSADADIFETTPTPVPPYSLADSARMKSDATRRFRDGVLTLAFWAEGAASLAHVAQRSDGTLAVRLRSPRPAAALDLVRFVLALDDDHRPFLERFRDDPLLASAIRRFRGLRPLRTATVTHALLKAVCGQLIQAKAARLLEARLLRAAAPEHAGLRLPPTRETFADLSPAALAARGLATRKAGVLVRLSRELDLERLRAVSSEVACRRIERERGLGPWSSAMICLHGLGRWDRGLVGDLGLVKLLAGLRGRHVEAEETRELLEPYAEWAGLASVYLLAGVPADGAPWERPRRQARKATVSTTYARPSSGNSL
jgi:3-methyladenine DNA glycosylase/8-oxoguanine DNA glycosylase